MGHIGLSIAEKLMDLAFDVVICLDDLSKHSKSYRQISLIIGKIPSRDAFPSDIFNVHSSLLERCGKLRSDFGGSSITGFPIIETINSDITEFIATNVISITDGQIYMNRKLFNDSIRPAIDSGLSVSRIGSAAQCKVMKIVSSGLKNRLTLLRNIVGNAGGSSKDDLISLKSLNLIFYHEHLFPLRLEVTMLLLLFSRLGFVFKLRSDIHKLLFLFSDDFIFLFYLLFISKTYSSPLLLRFFNSFISRIFNIL